MELLKQIISSNPILSTFGAFILGGFTEFFWCRWNQNVISKDALKASAFTGMIGISGLVYTLAIFANSGAAVVAYLIGCCFGTFIAVKWVSK